MLLERPVYDKRCLLTDVLTGVVFLGFLSTLIPTFLGLGTLLKFVESPLADEPPQDVFLILNCQHILLASVLRSPRIGVGCPNV